MTSETNRPCRAGRRAQDTQPVMDATIHVPLSSLLIRSASGFIGG
jgi:hypothetical protein